jgi:cysteine desulfurase
MVEVLADGSPNPSGAHRYARAAAGHLESAREVVAELLGVSPREIVFTSGGTEACALAMTVGDPDAPVAISAIEHVAIAEPARRRGGQTMIELPVDSTGVVDLRAALDLIPDRSVVAVMAANNETGAIQPIEELRGRLDDAGRSVTLVCDAIAAAPTEALEALVSSAEVLTIAGHKLGGPAGAGVVVVRSGASLSPLLVGGAQEGDRRAGTQNVAAAVGLAVALELATSERRGGQVALLRERRDVLARSVTDRLGAATLTSSAAPRLAGHVHLTIEGARSEELLFALDQRGLAASAGAACASGAPQASHVLLAMGVDPAQARGALRLTMATTTSDEEAKHAGACVVEVVDALSR